MKFKKKKEKKEEDLFLYIVRLRRNLDFIFILRELWHFQIQGLD
jgi:hypothetical protein